MANDPMKNYRTLYSNTALMFAGYQQRLADVPLTIRRSCSWLAAALVIGGVAYTLSAQAQNTMVNSDMYRIAQEGESVRAIALEAAPHVYLQVGDLQAIFHRVEIEGATLIPSLELANHLAPWLNQPLGIEQVHTAAKTLDRMYRSRGWSARTRLVKQDLYSGTLRLRVIEGSRSRRQQLAAIEGDSPTHAGAPLK